MRKNKSLIFFMTVITLIFSQLLFFSSESMADETAGGEENDITSRVIPENLHLTVETKEIDLEDIPEDRIIPLSISSENMPPYVLLSFILQKDSRLIYENSRQFEPNEDCANVGGISYDYGTRIISRC